MIVIYKLWGKFVNHVKTGGNHNTTTETSFEKHKNT